MSQAAAVALDPREVLKHDAASKDPVISKRLLRFCYARTRDVQRAKDAMSEALVRVLAGEGWHRWNHEGTKDPAESLLMHLCNVAKDVIKKERERASEWREVRGESKAGRSAADPGPAPGEMPEEWAKQDHDVRRAEAVMERLDEPTREMLRLESESDGEMDARELAKRLGWTVKQVYRARERVFYHRDAVLGREPKRGGAS
jgi:RNA polymerase sigma factor (sigma-70 family)